MKSICVYCGSSPGTEPDYLAAAVDCGTVIAKAGLTLVYGGGKVGLMGAVADAALAAGGRVIGVMPEHLVNQEIAHRGLTDLRVVGSMHERKLVMAELSDGFLCLPGGPGDLRGDFRAVDMGATGHPRQAVRLRQCRRLLRPDGRHDPTDG